MITIKFSEQREKKCIAFHYQEKIYRAWRFIFNCAATDMFSSYSVPLLAFCLIYAVVFPVFGHKVDPICYRERKPFRAKKKKKYSSKTRS